MEKMKKYRKISFIRGNMSVCHIGEKLSLFEKSKKKRSIYNYNFEIIKMRQSLFQM